jgi:hypothetical protein
MFPVCGRSGKLYGQAVLQPQFGGPVYEMTMEEYDAAKFDIIGNILFQQQWVPEFVKVEEAEKTGFEPIPSDSFPQILPESDPKSPRKEKSLVQRAKDAGVWKKGMTEEQIKEALGFPD